MAYTGRSWSATFLSVKQHIWKMLQSWSEILSSFPCRNTYKGNDLIFPYLLDNLIFFYAFETVQYLCAQYSSILARILSSKSVGCYQRQFVIFVLKILMVRWMNLKLKYVLGAMLVDCGSRESNSETHQFKHKHENI